MLVKLNEAQCRAAMAAGDFSADLRSAAPTVVIVLTQSWCPQWTRMRPWIEEFATSADRACYFVEYDRESFFDDFRGFKESRFKNDQVPYLRYYRDGALVRESNYVDRSTFQRLALPVAAS